jgi:hypothetical protein
MGQKEPHLPGLPQLPETHSIPANLIWNNYNYPPSHYQLYAQNVAYLAVDRPQQQTASLTNSY